MPPKTWKVVERRIARYLGTERTPLSGGNGRQTRSDTLHFRLYCEVKHGSSCPKSWSAIRKLWDDTSQKARVEGKIPVVILHRKGARNIEDYDCYIHSDNQYLICIPLSSLREIYGTSPPSIDARPGAEVKQATAGEPGGGSTLQRGSPAPATDGGNA